MTDLLHGVLLADSFLESLLVIGASFGHNVQLANGVPTQLRPLV